MLMISMNSALESRCHVPTNGLITIFQGIDRKDVRIVSHFNVPKSMEAFYQESGRAGRDQLPCRSLLYYGVDDRKKMVRSPASSLLSPFICFSFIISCLAQPIEVYSMTPLWQEFILSAASKQSESSTSQDRLSKKSISDFNQVTFNSFCTLWFLTSSLQSMLHVKCIQHADG